MTPEAVIADGARALGLDLDASVPARLARYSELVLKWNRVANLTGARGVSEFARRFVVDALAVSPWVEGPRVADLGSGAGLPGLVLAVALPALEFHLVEPRARRARFLEQARMDLGLANVRVHCARMEDWTPPVAIDEIICQAVGSLAYILEVTRHLQHHGARVLALKGQRPEAELDALGPAAAACEIIALRVPGWTERHLVRIDCARLPASA